MPAEHLVPFRGYPFERKWQDQSQRLVDAGIRAADGAPGDVAAIEDRRPARSLVQRRADRGGPTHAHERYVVDPEPAREVPTAAVARHQVRDARVEVLEGACGAGIRAGTVAHAGRRFALASHEKTHARPRIGDAGACDRDGTRAWVGGGEGVDRHQGKREDERERHPQERMPWRSPTSLEKSRRSRHRFLLRPVTRPKPPKRCRPTFYGTGLPSTQEIPEAGRESGAAGLHKASRAAWRASSSCVSSATRRALSATSPRRASASRCAATAAALAPPRLLAEPRTAWAISSMA